MRTWERRMDKAKKGHRPSLKNWSRDGFATTRREEFHRLRQLRKENEFTGVVNQNYPIQEVERLDIRRTSVDEFRQRFENQYLPCVIRGVPHAEQWSAVENWNMRSLRRRYKNHLFKCGEDDDGYKIKIKLRYFVEYMKHNQDDSPLYIFDANYDEYDDSKAILSDYAVPSLFPEDLFSLIGEKRRPPYRWFLLGPERSGTEVHIDPLGTSAWNTLLVGRKRWVLFPPGTPRDIVKGKTVMQPGEDDEAVNFFVDHLPRIRERYGGEIAMYEFIQYPGETVFVPGGWWHGVINLDDTIAITQNYCSSANFDRVWKSTRSGRKKMAVSWLKRLRIHRPDLASRADALNQQDNFEMYHRDPNKPKKSKKDKKRKKEASMTAAAASSDDDSDSDDSSSS
eukprot:gene9713-6951_t